MASKAELVTAVSKCLLPGGIHVLKGFQVEVIELQSLPWTFVQSGSRSVLLMFLLSCVSVSRLSSDNSFYH